MKRLEKRKRTNRTFRLRPLFILPWLLYTAAMIWYPIHVSVAARERIVAADSAKCRQRARTKAALDLCDAEYERNLEDAREINWRWHPLWNPIWFAPLALLLPPFAVYGVISIMTWKATYAPGAAAARVAFGSKPRLPQ